MPTLRFRIVFGPDQAIGPGKIELLEAVRDHGSISAAGRSLGMSYRRAWLLIDSMKHCFGRPVVKARPGGERGGGATLTALGTALIAQYRSIEAKSHAASAKELRAMAQARR